MPEFTLTQLTPAEEVERLRRELEQAQARIDDLMTQLEVANASTTQAGDDLPGFWTTDLLLKRLDDELDRARRYDKQVCVLIMQIDGWEHIVRTHTPETGTIALRAMARMISQFMRRSDLAAEYAGDCFLIIMPETPLEGARTFGERLCQAAESLHVFDVSRSRVLLRASGGVAMGSRDTLTRDSLLLSVKDRLAQAQLSGGGCICSG